MRMNPIPEIAGAGPRHPSPVIQSLRIARPLPAVRRSALLLPLALAACEDATGGGPPEVAQTCAAPVRLAVGESADLAADAEGRVRCSIQSGGQGEYVVAFVDTRATEKSRTQNEGYGDAFPPYTVTTALAEDVEPIPAPPASLSRGAPHLDVQHVEPPPSHGVVRGTPWTEGERFPLYDGVPQGPRTARVLRVYDERFVFAWFEGDNEAQVGRFVAQLDSAWASVRGHALPLLRAAYSGEDPLTSPGSGQYLVVLRDVGRGTALGWTVAIDNFGVPRFWTEVKVRPQASHLRLAELVAHELTHAFQGMYMYRTRLTAGGIAAGASFWGVEGSASLVEFETTRRAAGVALTANLDRAAASGGGPALQRTAHWSRTSTGRLTDGYDESGAFLRVQAARLVQAGASEDEAVAEVVRGASDGWHGYDHLNARRTGLTARMRARLGDGWSPEDALLDWALGTAADDRTPAARFQDPTFLRVWDVAGGGPRWPPSATLYDGAPSSVTRPYGSPDFMVLRVGGTQPFAAVSSVPGVRWRILRVS
jgi:hypothetical protein